MSKLKEASTNIINLPRYAKRSLAIIIDVGLCILCTWLAFYLRLEEFIKINDITSLAVFISVFLAIPIFLISGLYKTLFRFAGSSIVFTVFIATFAYSLLYFSIIGIYGIPGIPRSIGILQPLLLFLGIASSRILINLIFSYSFTNIKIKKKVLIYGAGSAGRQLLSSFENNPEMQVVGFLDDNPQFQKQKILGQTVYSPSNISKLIIKKNIDMVLLALTKITRKRKNKIIDSLNKHKIIVKTLPSIQDIVEGRITVSDIKDFTIEDLLSREQVQPNIELLSKNVNSKVVMITGAGGSIGAEISRQVIKLKPKRVLLVELNEFALYKIYEELKNTTHDLQIIPLLTNIQDSKKIDEILQTFEVESIFHTAAYKHVPLVEENVCESIKNNVLGTYTITQCALKYNVPSFVLISSDKAVRPTNIMGASKRLAEICVQSLYFSKSHQSKFSIVRFGNVLESSGSVIPKFKQQIKKGGPITLTHPDVTRYFMTVTEAAQLVIQAGAMGNKCEVFVLDMGESVKIKDLIIKMVKLSGLTIKDEHNLDGDIQIKITGLRAGEKLYEELLLGENPQKTYHEKIYKAQDPYITIDKLKNELDNLSELLEENKVEDVKILLSKLVNFYHSNSNIVDHIYREKLNLKDKKSLPKKIFNQESKIIQIDLK